MVSHFSERAFSCLKIRVFWLLKKSTNIGKTMCYIMSLPIAYICLSWWVGINLILPTVFSVFMESSKKSVYENGRTIECLVQIRKFLSQIFKFSRWICKFFMHGKTRIVFLFSASFSRNSRKIFYRALRISIETTSNDFTMCMRLISL